MGRTPPRAVQELRAEVVAAEEELRHRTGHEATGAELAAALGRTVEEVRGARATASAFTPDSLDALLPGGSAVGDHLASTRDEAGEIVLRAALHAEMGRLSPRERVILRLRFVEERTQSEIGEVIGVSQMQVSRLLGQLLTRLRERLEPGAAA
ncbi:sigma-70 family RNA polymerase sigma factor [Phycicoccus endophyticus]|uniref:Sigma-70 family RNA polymerase sigma factor n=1 Tax=Phycicoccus endophyticus TaxID=1690220 RepID=A0A7G9R172_9MICO|nr:sigma-70 family RNA polymerase sigma factor [Phycicoccus endophyticus]QNN49347.1 sigma-70 family RNA polymerase sigma factor [Phycicoccus endophyticus]